MSVNGLLDMVWQATVRVKSNIRKAGKSAEIRIGHVM
jgi:hypothetical protein